jgi:Ser/Thr protein kinase RdoA (MazF antagonist)
LANRERATFNAEELAVVLSHYDLGVIESLTEFARGSRRSPKVGIVSERGKFLLKRRAAERAHPDRVRFTHFVQARLRDAGFPIARLLAARGGHQTLVRVREHVYELFEFVPGQPYGQTVGETRDAGVRLGQFHAITNGLDVPRSLPRPRGDYHDAAVVRTGLCAIGSTLKSHDSFTGDDAELASLVQFMLEAYDAAADAVNAIGLGQWPECIVHSDWHPGNLLFWEGAVAAVIDYDSVRYARRIVDVANGLLQFSITAGGDPASWPDHLDEERFAAFIAGYASASSVGAAERACLPHLMAEALITECVAPIAATGSVGRWSGFRVLKMVRRKLQWLSANRDRLFGATA